MKWHPLLNIAFSFLHLFFILYCPLIPPSFPVLASLSLFFCLCLAQSRTTGKETERERREKRDENLESEKRGFRIREEVKGSETREGEKSNRGRKRKKRRRRYRTRSPHPGFWSCFCVAVLFPDPVSVCGSAVDSFSCVSFEFLGKDDSDPTHKVPGASHGENRGKMENTNNPKGVDPERIEWSNVSSPICVFPLPRRPQKAVWEAFHETKRPQYAQSVCALHYTLGKGFSNLEGGSRIHRGRRRNTIPSLLTSALFAFTRYVTRGQRSLSFSLLSLTSAVSASAFAFEKEAKGGDGSCYTHTPHILCQMAEM